MMKVLIQVVCYAIEKNRVPSTFDMNCHDLLKGEKCVNLCINSTFGVV